jgi:hypothetical protein
MVKPVSLNSCEPRWATPRTSSRRTLGAQAAAVAERLGTRYLPWQRLVADVGLELLPDGRPAYREVLVTVPRQSGKTTLILSVEVQRAVGWAPAFGPQRIVYSAQTGADARKKLLEDQLPVLEPRRKLLGISRITRAIGSESLLWTNGSRLVLLASSSDSGHGKTLDLGMQDELFADVDHRRDQAMIPAMATRQHAQLWGASTMGTGDSQALNMKVAKARAAVEAGKTTGIAYFEWSADVADDPADPATWWRCMPALGRTIGLEAVEHAYQTMSLGEFKRAFLNIATVTNERVIPQTAWDLVCDPHVEATAGRFGIDVNPERSAAAIVVAGPGPVLEVIDYRAGIAWLVPRCVELHRRYGAGVVLDGSGPAASEIAALRAQGVPIEIVTGQDVTRAAGAFYDRIVEGNLRIRRHQALDEAAGGAAKLQVGDAWKWGRRSSNADIAPLVAATVALWSLIGPEPEEEEVLIYDDPVSIGPSY